MMARLEFDLSDEDDKHEFHCCITGTDARLALDDIKQEVRRYWKYGDFEHEETEDIVNKIYEFIYNAMVERGVSDL